MKTKATRNGEYTEVEQILYMSMELSLKEWKLAFSTSLGRKPRFRDVASGNLRGLAKEIEAGKKRFGLPAKTRVVSCYEAGRDGFGIHRYLMSVGVESLVVDSASIEVNRRARRAKSDKLDSRKLLTMLIRYCAGEREAWSVVHVPTVEEEDERHLHRELRSWKGERTRATNRIKGLLANHGLRWERPWDLPRQLKQMKLWDGSPLPAGLRSRLLRQWEQLQFTQEQISALEADRRKKIRESETESVAKVRQLMLLRAIGPNFAWVSVYEFFGWRKFKNRKEVGSLAGLTGTPYQSGNENREQGISKAGNRHIRSMAIEIAWLWLRHQPQSRLSRWYRKRFAKAGPRARRIGIVALARRLLIDLWRFLELGVIPEGATLKA